ncbi:Protein CBG23988 [Caenorhabditis briggsae]|uniref:Protein CBG23988 n=1 Tax=Caenorhabditis briggsae TaxID=6238 RepID=A8WJQ9_CAEBR|nr:Protein CBG23988 [Caenorhabditis briggsae]CAP20702.2 Protein CBG23988 [Caenorhabditis briggsae]
MINSKKCGYGTLSKGSSNVWSTNNKIEVDYPNRFTSFFSPKRFHKENCIVIETKVYSHFNQSKPTNILADMNNCKYQDGFCEIKKNEIITWDVNRDQKCQFISIGILDGMYNNKLWVNNKNQIALNFETQKIVNDCNIDLMISDEGFAVKRIERSQYSPRHIPIPIPSYSQQDIQRQRQQQEDDRRKREQEEQQRKREQEDSRRRDQEDIRKRDQEDARRRDQERQKQNEADFEKRKQEKLKKEEELEKKKQEKTKKAQEEAERKEIEALRKLRKDEDWTVHDEKSKGVDKKSNRTKREIFQPLPLPNYDEYLKIKQDCDNLPSYEIDFIDVTHFDGYKLSIALTLGQIPIKIKSLGDKIWYYKNDNFGGVISSKPQLHPMIDYRTNITNMKSFKEFDLKFLDDKVVFHEHILLDLKTNIEEELIEEMREKSDVSIEAHASNQDSTLPHEILDDVEGFFGKWWLRIWRVGVTLPAMFVYLFIARSFWMILSPKTFIDRKNRKRKREYEAVELREMPSIQSLTVD